MKYVNNGEVNPEIADTLYEIGNVGVGMASIALGKMLGIGISIGIPHVASVESDIDSIIKENPEKIAIGILMSLEKTLSGTVLFVIDNKFLTDLINKLTGNTLSAEDMVEDEESLSAIQEVANIMAASYMKSIGAYTGIRVYLSPVMVGVDMLGALISYPLAQLGINNEQSICVDTSFSVMGDKNGESVGRIIMFPNEDSVIRILDALKE